MNDYFQSFLGSSIQIAFTPLKIGNMIFGEAVRSTERLTEEKSKLDGDEGHDLPITVIFYPLPQHRVRGVGAGTVNTYNPCRYRGYYYDYETSMYYLQTRYYVPAWGRFLNADGYVNANGDLIGFNMYAYCSNNPIMYQDPSGCFIISASLVVAIVLTTTILGAASGAAINGITYCIENDAFSQDVFDDSNFWASVLNGTISGGINGLASGITLITGGTAGTLMAISALAGGVGSFAGSVAENLITKEKTGLGLFVKALEEAAWGATFGFLFGAISGSSSSVSSIAKQKGRSFAAQLAKTLQFKVLRDAGITTVQNIMTDSASWYAKFVVQNSYENAVNTFVGGY